MLGALRFEGPDRLGHCASSHRSGPEDWPGQVQALGDSESRAKEAGRDKRIGLSKVHGPVSPADIMTKHVDHATQIRLLSLMSVEACLGRAETAPETGNVDEQVCSVESTAGENEEYDWPDVDCEEKLMDWFHGCMNNLVEEVNPGIFGAGDTQIKCKEPGEMSLEKVLKISSCQIECTENGEMILERIDTKKSRWRR